MKRTILIILCAVLILGIYGCGGVFTENTEEITTEEVTTEDPVAVLKSKVHNRIASDAENICKSQGISPGNVFFMSFSEAVSKFVTPTGINIYSCEEAVKSGALSYAERRDILDDIGGLTANNIYVYELKGRVMKNPAVPYLISEEATVLRLAIIYDNDANLYGHAILEVNENLRTCVTISVTTF